MLSVAFIQNEWLEFIYWTTIGCRSTGRNSAACWPMASWKSQVRDTAQRRFLHSRCCELRILSVCTSCILASRVSAVSGGGETYFGSPSHTIFAITQMLHLRLAPLVVSSSNTYPAPGDKTYPSSKLFRAVKNWANCCKKLDIFIDFPKPPKTCVNKLFILFDRSDNLSFVENMSVPDSEVKCCILHRSVFSSLRNSISAFQTLRST